MEKYDLIQGEETIGWVQVQQEGLYLRFTCRCTISGEVMYDLILQTDEKTQNLGLLAPVNGGFGLSKCISAKKAGQGGYQFFLKPRHEKLNTSFVPIKAEEPFAYLTRIQQAHLVRRGDAMGLIFDDKNNGEIM